MIIAVLLKQVDLVCALSGREAEQSFVAPVDHVCYNNPLDEVALEQAVRIKGELGHGDVWVFCLSEDLIHREALRTMAMGADHFVHLWDPSWASLDAWATARVLSTSIEMIGASLVLGGASSLDLGRGEVGVYVAEQLGFPYVSSVVSLKTRPDGLFLQRALGKGDREELEAEYPLCIGVDHRLCEPRYPSRVSLLAARGRDIFQWRAEDLGVKERDMELRVQMGPLLSPRPRTKWIPQLDGRLPGFERAQWLLAGTGGEKQGTLLQGDPGKLGKELLNFLRDKRLISDG